MFVIPDTKLPLPHYPYHLPMNISGLNLTSSCSIVVFSLDLQCNRIQLMVGLIADRLDVFFSGSVPNGIEFVLRMCLED